MREIPLTQGYIARVDNEDYERAITAGPWYASDRKDGRVYAIAVKNDNKTTYLHRFILGITDRKTHVDHADHDGLNNQRSNLRATTTHGNGANRRKSRNNTSGYKGVSWNSNLGKWKVDIMVKGKSTFLGYFTDAAEASKVYDAAAREYYGEFAATNAMLRETISQ